MEIQTHQSVELNASVVLERVYGAYQPPRDVSISEWAIENRILANGNTSRPVPFRPEQFQIEMMDVILQPYIQEVIIQKLTQIQEAKTSQNPVSSPRLALVR
jgi:phage terminase large subunit GpA-like protein